MDELDDIVEEIILAEEDKFRTFGPRQLNSIKGSIKDDTTRLKTNDVLLLAEEGINTRVMLPANKAYDAITYSLRNSSEILFRLDTGREGTSGITNKFKFGPEALRWTYQVESYSGARQGKWSSGAREGKGMPPIVYSLNKHDILAAFQLPAFSKDAFCIWSKNRLYKFCLLMKADRETSINRSLYYAAFDELIFRADNYGKKV